MQVIIYDNGVKGVGIITPVLNNGMTIEEVAAKSVPIGADFEIVESSTIDTSIPHELRKWV